MYERVFSNRIADVEFTNARRVYQAERKKLTLRADQWCFSVTKYNLRASSIELFGNTLQTSKTEQWLPRVTDDRDIAISTIKSVFCYESALIDLIGHMGFGERLRSEIDGVNRFGNFFYVKTTTTSGSPIFGYLAHQ